MNGDFWWWVGVAALFVFGTIAGRFCNRCVDRFERCELTGRGLREQLQSALFPEAYERTLWSAQRWFHHLPVIGRWLPGNPYRVQHWKSEARRTVVELLDGLLCVAVYWADTQWTPQPMTSGASVCLSPGGWRVACLVIGHVVLVQGLVIATFIDLSSMLIPDGSTVPFALFGVIFALLSGGTLLVPLYYYDPSIAAALGWSRGDPFAIGDLVVPTLLCPWPHLHALLASIAGIIAGAGVVWIVRIVGHWGLNREAMGFGDVMLMGMVGAFLGWQPVLAVFFVAPVFALAFVAVKLVLSAVCVLFRLPFRFDHEIPFGPWLSLGAIAMIVAWPLIWPAAERIFLLGPLLLPMAVAITAILAVLLRGMRLLKQLAGIDEDWLELEAWSSADQLQYDASRREQPGLRCEPPGDNWSLSRHNRRWRGKNT
ncbi:prepilin peptidase [Stratiformator vulcanicus]|uniref:Type 4 prepilin-like proteins leader peptide-processing enzyme n=1 Tax=Stratiformator vulcanicus TaxID=2527980 RepID=A0A517R2M2_9PLAN|nr:A24 family peptidase [Stratiformator vulcanicus]QDT38104.1 Type 4 prepilin-like proteins leader peptide-processing enzyme [Stratiformator vulcanicus]